MIARDRGIDALKGWMVLAMIFVHPLMMMGDANGPTAALAIAGDIITTPIAPAFLFALGYVMGLRTRPASKVFRRLLITGAGAVAFGLMLLYLTGEFLFSVLFTATVGLSIVGFGLSRGRAAEWIERCALTVSFLAVISIAEMLPGWVSGAVTIGGVNSVWKWNTPLIPYLLFSLLGGAHALRKTETISNERFNRIRNTLVLSAAVPLAMLVASSPSWGGIAYSLAMLALIYAMPALAAAIGKNQPAIVMMLGRRVTMAYFVHHLIIALYCIATTGGMYAYSRFGHSNLDASAHAILMAIPVAIVGTTLICQFYDQACKRWLAIKESKHFYASS